VAHCRTVAKASYSPPGAEVVMDILHAGGGISGPLFLFGFSPDTKDGPMLTCNQNTFPP
jgi:hypothetical protein